MKLKNIEISNYIQNLNAVSNKVTGKLGYCVAWNLRNFSNINLEFEQIRNELINKYGTEQEDESGKIVASISVGTEEYSKFLEEIKEYSEIEHEVNVLNIQPEDVYGSSLTANEILGIYFMIEEPCENPETSV